MSEPLPSPDPDDLALWGLHAFCLGARRTPHRVVMADNNGRLLYLARGGTTRAALAAAGEPCLDSQLTLLQLMGLLQVRGEELRTGFPVLGGALMQALRARVRAVALPTAQALAEDALRVRALLAAQGHAGHDHAVVFGHALDGVIWGLLGAGGRLPDTALSIERPYWNGAFWAMHPKRAGVAGTNEVQRGDDTLVAVWTADTLAGLNALAQAWRQGHGLAGLPVIRPGGDDPVHRHCLAIATRAAAALDGLVDTLHAEGLLPCTRPELLLVAGHEFIWDVMAALCAAGHVSEPAVLRAADAGVDALRALVFIRAGG